MTIEGKLFPYKRKILKLFTLAEKFLQEDFSCVCVSVGFVTEEEIRQANKKFREVDRVTDVLSFPNLNKQVGQKLSEFESEKFDGSLFLGDIIICKKQAKRQAEEFGHSVKREVCFLALHGLLHLLGFDHMNAQDEKLMNATAQKILSAFGVER